jgi:hypothetical protein
VAGRRFVLIFLFDQQMTARLGHRNADPVHLVKVFAAQLNGLPNAIDTP